MKVSEIIAKSKCCPDSDEPKLEAGEGIWQGKKVKLNDPRRGPPKKFFVYVKNENGNVVKVSFGDPNSTVKNGDPKASASFRARHKCDEQTDKTSAAYWSCNVGKYWKQLGLSSNKPW
jgi:hypothetical protein